MDPDTMRRFILDHPRQFHPESIMWAQHGVVRATAEQVDAYERAIEQRDDIPGRGENRYYPHDAPIGIAYDRRLDSIIHVLHDPDDDPDVDSVLAEDSVEEDLGSDDDSFFPDDDAAPDDDDPPEFSRVPEAFEVDQLESELRDDARLAIIQQKQLKRAADLAKDGTISKDVDTSSKDAGTSSKDADWATTYPEAAKILAQEAVKAMTAAESAELTSSKDVGTSSKDEAWRRRR